MATPNASVELLPQDQTSSLGSSFVQESYTLLIVSTKKNESTAGFVYLNKSFNSYLQKYSSP